jgi:hypothetical protein
MSDPPPSALGIEAVEWYPQGGENLTVRVTGRWRRRRPTWSGQPLLVIEAQGTRHRFPAMPEPPSLTGTAPGTWRMSFSVPASLAPHLGGRTWLALGAVVVPLPIEVEPTVPDRPVTDPGTLVQRQLRSSELAAQAARRRAAEAEEALAELASRVEQRERELEQARLEPERLNALLGERERARRSAEQHVHAERALREELQEQLADQQRERGDADSATAELAAVKQRVLQLEEESEGLRRQGDEAEQVAAAAYAARERAERRLAELGARPAVAGPGPGGPQAIAAQIRSELAIARRAPPAMTLRPRPAAAAPLRGLALEREMIAMRAIAPASAPELAELRAIAERERAGRAEAQARASRLEHELHEYAIRSARTHDAIAELRGQLQAVRLAYAGQATDPSPGTGPPLDPTRPPADSEAPPVDPEGPSEGPAPQPVKNWLPHVFRGLADQDPAAAGRLAVALLPAQRLVHSAPLAYDLVLKDLGCVQVDVGTATTRVELAQAPRATSDVQFQVVGDLASLARLMAAGQVRRQIGRRRGRVKGDRNAVRALTSLVRVPLTLAELHAAGVRIEPALALRLVSLMVDPDWTKGTRFTIAYEDRRARAPAVYLHVRDGAPLSITDSAETGAVPSTISCSGQSLLAVLDGAPAADAVVRGDEHPLAQLLSWVKRAQSG